MTAIEPPRRRAGPWWLLALLPLLPVLGLGYLLDDYVYLLERSRADFVYRLWPYASEFHRPLAYAVLYLERLLFEGRPWLWHASHLTLYVAAAWLTGRLAGRLVAPGAAPWAAALSLVYPGRLETVAWLSSIFDLLALLLITCALCQALDQRRRPTAPGLVGLAALGFAAPLAKEIGYAIGPILVGWELLGVGGRARPRARAAVIVAVVAGHGLAMLYRLASLDAVGGYGGGVGAPWLLRGAARVPEALARATLMPVTPWLGTVSLGIGLLCAVSLATLLAHGLPRVEGPTRLRAVAAGAVVLAAGLAPCLPYLETTAVWTQSRYLTLPGLGIVLIASAALVERSRVSRVLAGMLIVTWGAATLVNLVPWREAAATRDQILDSVERATRAGGLHQVYVAGAIHEWRGVPLLGGDLEQAIRFHWPTRRVSVDSEDAQRWEGRPVGVPVPETGATLHVFVFSSEGPTFREVVGLHSGPG